MSTITWGGSNHFLRSWIADAEAATFMPSLQKFFLARGALKSVHNCCTFIAPLLPKPVFCASFTSLSLNHKGDFSFQAALSIDETQFLWFISLFTTNGSLESIRALDSSADEAVPCGLTLPAINEMAVLKQLSAAGSTQQPTAYTSPQHPWNEEQLVPN